MILLFVVFLGLDTKKGSKRVVGEEEEDKNWQKSLFEREMRLYTGAHYFCILMYYS